MGGVSASKDASEPLTTPLGVAGPCGATSACAFPPSSSVLLCWHCHHTSSPGEPSLAWDVPMSRQNQATSVLGKRARFLSVTQQKTLIRFFPCADLGKRHQRGSFCFCFSQSNLSHFPSLLLVTR